MVNADVNGNTTADLLARVDEDVIALAPDAVVLLAGTNDVLGDVPLAESRAHIEQIVDRIRAVPAHASPSCHCHRSAGTRR